MQNTLGSKFKGLKTCYPRTTEVPSSLNLSLVSHLGHELRTPLSEVLGIAEILSHEPLTQNQLMLVEHIRESGNHLLSAINTMLDKSNRNG